MFHGNEEGQPLGSSAGGGVGGDGVEDRGLADAARRGIGDAQVGARAEVRPQSGEQDGTELRAIDGALHVAAAMGPFSTNVKLEGKCKVLGIDLCPDFSGTITIDKIRFTGDVAVWVVDGVVHSNLPILEVKLDNLKVHINGILGFLFNWLIDIVVDVITPNIENLFGAQLQAQVGGIFSGLFDQLALNQQFELPPFLEGMSPLVLALATRVERLEKAAKA